MFHFKQFSVRHDRCAMKVGTDGVLLGAWCDVGNRQRILDVGTGTGLIALMVAQRNAEAQITAIDIDQDAVEQARENVEASPWNDRIAIRQCDFTSPSEIHGDRFDLIVSNPPFFKEQVHSDDEKRDIARSSDALPLKALIGNAASLLTEDGILSLILPSQVVDEAIGEAALCGLYLSRRCAVRTKASKPSKRSLLEFSKSIKNTEISELVLNDADNLRSNNYRILTEEFYL